MNYLVRLWRISQTYVGKVVRHQESVELNQITFPHYTIRGPACYRGQISHDFCRRFVPTLKPDCRPQCLTGATSRLSDRVALWRRRWRQRDPRVARANSLFAATPAEATDHAIRSPAIQLPLDKIPHLSLGNLDF